jgi:hypothetical protein
MKNRILVITLCFGSLVLGAILNSYWRHADVLLKTDAAYEEMGEVCRDGLAACRSMVYANHDKDMLVYQFVLSNHINPSPEASKLAIDSVWSRYNRIVQESEYRHQTLNSTLDHAQGGKEHSLKNLESAKEFINLNANKFGSLQ